VRRDPGSQRFTRASRSRPKGHCPYRGGIPWLRKRPGKRAGPATPGKRQHAQGGACTTGVPAGMLPSRPRGIQRVRGFAMGAPAFFAGRGCPQSSPAAAPPVPSGGRLVLSSPPRADRPGASTSGARCHRPGRRSEGRYLIRRPFAPDFETTQKFGSTISRRARGL
jgi:hypothetical protein